jgi:hypothetical protein
MMGVGNAFLVNNVAGQEALVLDLSGSFECLESHSHYPLQTYWCGAWLVDKFTPL